jgi:hypothetical protein
MSWAEVVGNIAFRQRTRGDHRLPRDQMWKVVGPERANPIRSIALWHDVVITERDYAEASEPLNPY